ncbi:MAG: FKBP-type peptidyl-prolyl cis-trans isomerase [Thermodesulfobacteriota bacterium]
MSKKAERGDAVTFNYEGRIEDGSTFHTFEESPITVDLGSGSLVKGLEEGLIGMADGEEKEFRVSPENGYGVEKPELIHTIDSNLFAGTEITPEVGMVLKTPHGNCHITRMEEGKIEISYNHPLAGRTLDYRVKVIKVVKK